MPVRTGQSALPGTFISESGMSPDKWKIAVIKDWPIPQTVTELRQFLGLASYYRRYIQQFADIVTPIHHLTENTATFVLTEECQKAFQRL